MYLSYSQELSREIQLPDKFIWVNILMQALKQTVIITGEPEDRSDFPKANRLQPDVNFSGVGKHIRLTDVNINTEI